MGRQTSWGPLHIVLSAPRCSSWSMLIFAMMFSCLPLAAQSAILEAGNIADFLNGCQDSKVNEIHVLSDLTMIPALWPAQPVVISRDLKVIGKGHYPFFNMEGLHSCGIKLAPGVHLRIEHMRWVNSVADRLRPSLTVFCSSPGAVVWLVDTQRVLDVCAPFEAVVLTSNMPRPPGYPGKNLVYLPPCWTGPGEAPQQLLGSMYVEHLVMQVSESEFGQGGGFILVFDRGSVLCNNAVSSDCLRAKGMMQCYAEALERPTSDPLSWTAAKWGSCLGLAVFAILFLYSARVTLWPRRGFGLVYLGPKNSIMANDAKSGSSQSGHSGTVLSSAGTPVTDKAWLSSSSNMLEPPSLDNLQLGKVIGAGSFGTVYQGRWHGTLVAVKVVALQPGADPSASDLELRLSLSFNHPNVVRTFYHFAAPRRPHRTSSGSLETLLPVEVGERACGAAPSLEPPLMDIWIIQELCDEGNLGSALRQGRFMARANAGPPLMHALLLRALDVARGLRYLHEQKVCHGDLKSHNVLLCYAAHDPFCCMAKVADFGLSRMLEEGKEYFLTGSYGTVTHAAPEVLRGGRMTPASDIFSFGILLYELATGGQAHMGMSCAEVLSCVVLQNLRPTMPGHIPPEYARLAAACWDSDPLRRPSVVEIEAALVDMLDHHRELQRAMEDSLAGIMGFLGTMLS